MKIEILEATWGDINHTSAGVTANIYYADAEEPETVGYNTNAEDPAELNQIIWAEIQKNLQIVQEPDFFPILRNEKPVPEHQVIIQNTLVNIADLVLLENGMLEAELDILFTPRALREAANNAEFARQRELRISTIEDMIASILLCLSSTSKEFTLVQQIIEHSVGHVINERMLELMT